MIDFALIAGFDWDDGNRRKSDNKHGVSQAEAEQVFMDERILIADDVAHSEIETRYQALGKTSEGRRLHVSFTLRRDGTHIRVISARDMNRKERTRYETQT
jgi:uncharacterized DUF497 family protein